MSMHFFHKSLLEAKELIEKGDKESLKKAKKIILSHSGNIIDGETKEKKEFQHLLTETSNFIRDLETVNEWLDKDRRYALKKLEEALKEGKAIILHAKGVVKLCKDEELEIK